ncbi:MAG: hypothetical protein K8R06_10870, partial [Methanosarcinales archaeon]|nr:hypothetical protein [Methanosarcinales archaeon]
MNNTKKHPTITTMQDQGFPHKQISLNFQKNQQIIGYYCPILDIFKSINREFLQTIIIVSHDESVTSRAHRVIH